MSELKQRWQALRETQSGLRIRDAATQLGVSEAALLETRVGEGVSRLAVRIETLCAALPQLGTVMSLIRNDAAVHEKDVAFPAGVAVGEALCFEGEGFALTLLPASIRHAFYVEDASPKGLLRSIQLFDAIGTALWKIYARDKADHAAFAGLLAGLAWPSDVEPMPFARLAPSTGWTPPSSATDLQSLLEGCAAASLPMQLDVANHGVRQSHRASLRRIVRMGPWLNVLDPGFDWHLNENELASAILDRETLTLTLHLAAGGEAARLGLDASATTAQRAVWRMLLDKAMAA